MLVFSKYCFLNIPLHTEKNNRVEELRKVLEMEVKTYTPVRQKSVFEKIRFKVWHYIKPDFIHYRPRFKKDQASMFISLVTNYFIHKYSNGYIKGNKYSFFIKLVAANVLLKLNYL